MTNTITRRPEVKTKYTALVEVNEYDVTSVNIVQNKPSKEVIKQLYNTRVLGLLHILDCYQGEITVILNTTTPSYSKIIPMKIEQRKIPLIESDISVSSYLKN